MVKMEQVYTGSSSVADYKLLSAERKRLFHLPKFLFLAETNSCSVLPALGKKWKKLTRSGEPHDSILFSDNPSTECLLEWCPRTGLLRLRPNHQFSPRLAQQCSLHHWRLFPREVQAKRANAKREKMELHLSPPRRHSYVAKLPFRRSYTLSHTQLVDSDVHTRFWSFQYRQAKGDSDTGSTTAWGRVPKGFIAVYVGKEELEQERFVIPVGYLNHRRFEELLRGAEEEFGFEQRGALTIPCEVSEFKETLELIEKEGRSFQRHSV